ncbi:arsenosugar biosynthesis radical SAM (seleno)protein ArsS [Methylococcus sp. EFPC2]|uniref:arsenosugar biosynthesis radical SAM (seleno)protein ArsS n=1 Tax=Methylococcus sp. EFPC2 TaxID=2812648 RepID=UPI001966FDD9|nr:arsenosugar biosynthesis radical SAM (seleno)protein ArsS [Methylococcus sp. EFPC2]QSA96324.1 arsenosugar biosynthesis radical SAM protein ArsS [Methylococcus sp. EFPC2]
MHALLPLVRTSDFPNLTRGRLETVQVNLGYRCNQACLHCHVNASPKRKEMMTRETVEQVLAWLRRTPASTLDLTGGAPEMNPHFRYLVDGGRELGLHVIDRCNLTILEEPGYEDLADFLAERRVEITASLPCYLEDNVDRQRGDGVFQASIRGLGRLNALGYGSPDSGLVLNLVYNPQGPTLPPAQAGLEADYHRELDARYGIRFNRLYALANMPIQRFGSTLVSRGQFEPYLRLLKQAHREENLENVMCRSLISVDWQGYVHDCDFNQMLGLPLGGTKRHVTEIDAAALPGQAIITADHCYGCTADAGSSCGGALSGSTRNAPDQPD